MNSAARLVRPFAFDALPSVSRAEAEATRALARLLAGLPRNAEVSVRRLGKVTLALQRVRLEPARRHDELLVGTQVLVRLGGALGVVVVETHWALGMVAALIEAPPPTVLRPLGRAERGVLAGFLVAVLQGLGLSSLQVSLQVSLEDPSHTKDRDDTSCWIAIELQVEAAGVTGRACLRLPSACLAMIEARPPRIDASCCVTSLVLELGRTSLAASDWAVAAVGDAVVFEGVSPVSVNQAWPLVARVGDVIAAAHLAQDGTLRISQYSPSNRPEREAPMKSADDTKADTLKDPLKPPAPIPPEVARALGAAPLEVVAELGRITVRGDELAGLFDGGVLSLGVRHPASVTLRVGDRPWASGELVTVDDQLAVRITEILR
jgi:type III secretion system YscQ/HrcQ family protein